MNKMRHAYTSYCSSDPKRLPVSPTNQCQEASPSRGRTQYNELESSNTGSFTSPSTSLSVQMDVPVLELIDLFGSSVTKHAEMSVTSLHVSVRQTIGSHSTTIKIGVHWVRPHLRSDSPGPVPRREVNLNFQP